MTLVCHCHHCIYLCSMYLCFFKLRMASNGCTPRNTFPRSASWQSPARREEVRVSVCESVKYYGHQLLTDAIVSCAFPSMVFIHVESTECSPARSTSFINMEEVSAVQHVVARLRETRPWASIAVLTFYKGQLQARRLIVLRSLCCYNHACHTIQRCACPV